MSKFDGPTSLAGRLEFVDSLRGFALLGVFWANLLIFSGISYMTDDQRSTLISWPLDSIAYFFEQFFIENKFMGLFSFLFGISFWLFISRSRLRGGAGTSLFYRRILWLFLIGLAHGGLLWCFDVLRFYALWALLLPLFVNTPPRYLLAFAISASVLVPALISGLDSWVTTSPNPATDFDAEALLAFSSGSYWEVLTANWQYDAYLTLSIGQIGYQVAVFGRLLLGLYVARSLDLGNLGAYRALLRKVLIAGGLAGVVGSTIFTGDLLTGGTTSPLLIFLRRFLVESGQLGFTLAYASGLALLFFTERWRSAIRAFAPVGRMALTWYLLQTVFGIWMFYGFARGPALMGQAAAAPLAALTLAGFVVQIWLARAWLRRFRFGPAEWLWRSATYWQIQPLRIAAQQGAALDAKSASRSPRQ